MLREMRFRLAMLALPSGLDSNEVFKFLKVDPKAAIKEHGNEALEQALKARLDNILQNMIKTENKDTMTLAVLLTNAKLTDLQKSQVAAILAGGSAKTDYLQ